MVQQVMRSAGIRHPSSVVRSQVDLYSHYDVGQERSSYSRQHSQVEQVVDNRKEQDICAKDDSPESEFHGDVLGIGGR